MKVLHVIDSLGLGGAQTIIQQIFDRQFDNPNIYAIALRKKDIETPIKHPNIKILESKSKYTLRPVFQLRDFVQENNIDIVHCHLFRSEVFGYWLKKFFCKDVSLILHQHGQIVGSDFNSSIENYSYPRFLRRSKKLVDRYVAVSQSMKDFMIKKSDIPGEAISLLYNFVDLNKFKIGVQSDTQASTFRKKYGFKDQDFLVGFAGRIIERKGWRTLLEAAAIVKETHPHIKFILAGDGPEAGLLQDKIRELKIQDVLQHIGYFNKMPLMYTAIDALAMPSHFEGLPMTQLEVMAMGVPMVTTDGPGMAEVAVADKDALYFKMKDPNDLAKKLIALENDNLRKKLVQNALETVKEYSLSSYLMSLDKLYESLR